MESSRSCHEGQGVAVPDKLDHLEQEALDRSFRLFGGLKHFIVTAIGWVWQPNVGRSVFTVCGFSAWSPQSTLIGDGVRGTCDSAVYGNVTALLLQYPAGAVLRSPSGGDGQRW